jgi:polar amino acid transport system permease protein
MTEAVALLLEGLWNTTLLTAAGALLATICALAAGLARVSRDPILRAVSMLYIELFRGTSALVQLFWFYFALPLFLGVSLPAFIAAVLVLGLNIGSYGAEVVRGALSSVAPSQHEAAVALGLTRRQRMRHIILPQAVPAMLPPAGNLLIELLKATALVSMITINDVTFAADRIREHSMQTGAAYGVALLLYFALALSITVGMRRLACRYGHGFQAGKAAV